MSKIFRVSTAAEFQTALSNAKGGDSISLAPGNYGDVDIFSHNYTSPIIINSQQEDNKAVFRTINVWNSKNISIDSVSVNFSADSETTSTTQVVRITQSSAIALTNSDLKGDSITVDGESSPVGRAINATLSTGIHIEGNNITEFRSGIILSSDHVTIANNSITDLRTSFITGWTSDTVISGNEFRDTRPVNLGGAGDHANVIHLWTTPTKAIENVTISDNFFGQDDGLAIWGIYIEDTVTSGLGSHNIAITNNVIFNSVSQAIIARNMHDSVISNNTLIHAGGGDERSAPTIHIGSDSTNVTVHDNILGKEIINVQTAAELATSSIVGNVVVDRFDKLAPNFIANAFVNPLVAVPEIADLQTKPGGWLAGRAVGADMTRFDPSPDELTARAIVTPVDRGQASYHLDAGLTANAGGFVSATAASFRWLFGDGTTATGKVVDHTYARSGAYQVTLEVTHTNGEKDTFRTVAVVPDPQLLRLGVEGSAAGDLSSYDSSVTGDATVVTSGGRKALHFDSGDHVSVTRTTARQIFDLDGFSYRVDLQATAGRASAGELFRIHTALTVSVDANGALHMAFTNAEEKTFKLDTPATALLNGAWHSVTISYDALTESAVILVDGAKVGAATMRGQTQALESWGLDVGGRWTPGFTGNISALELRSVDGPASAVTPPSAPETAPAPTPPPADHGAADVRLDFAFETSDPGGRIIGDARIVREGDNGVMRFDGNGDALDIGLLPALAGSPEVSFAFDFKPAAISADPARLFWAHTEYGVELLGDTIALRVGTESGQMVQLRAAPGGVAAGQWNHLVVNLDEDAGTAQVFLNGALVLDRSGLALDISGDNAWTAKVGGAFGDDFAGRIDNLVIQNAPLGTLAAAAPAPSPAPPAPPAQATVDPLFHFAFETSDPGGRIIGDARIVREGDNGVMRFDGNGDALDIGLLPALAGSPEVSFAFDFKPAAISADPARLFWAHTEYGVELLGDTIALRVGTESGQMVQLRAAPGGVAAGQWNHLVVNLDEDAGTAQVFLNGALVLDRSGLALDISGDNAWTAKVGGAFGDDFAGRIDNLVIHNAPLDPLALAVPTGGDLLFS